MRAINPLYKHAKYDDDDGDDDSQIIGKLLSELYKKINRRKQNNTHTLICLDCSLLLLS